jgi:putative endonuclease
MAEHNDLGKMGEELAIEHLRKNNYVIRSTNFRAGKNEIDIIAVENNELVIIEVKTRSSNYAMEPECAVTRAKQRSLVLAANIYITRNNIDMEVRFDIIGILVQADAHVIRHIKDAFYPLLR